MTSGIYKIINTKNGKFYVGSSNNIERRFLQHKKMLNENRHDNIKLQNAWKKYGEKSFEFIIFKRCSTNRLITEEQKILDKESNLYNISTIADHPPSHKGISKSEEHKKKISKSQKGIPKSEELKRKVSLGLKKYFKEHPEAREHLKNLRTGTKLSLKDKKKLRKSKKRGEEHHNCSLSESDVLDIRYKYKPKDYSLRKLADEYRVDKRTILNIIHRKTWTHI